MGRGGRGRGYSYYPDQDNYSESTEFFEQRKAERNLIETGAVDHSNTMNFGLADGEKMWSKKMDATMGKQRQAKNLGSAARFLDDSNDNRKYLPKNQEKVVYGKSRDQEIKELNDLD